ncbi:TIM barrel protein [Lacticaseibacillus parahuelsenbergensis]|uniref:TIM barrel protein n=1 Tax=Lacticaseibacillus parahuelsenbergensis TaxID=3068305 RepID=A0ABY9KZY4_9LACO|nr:TIM barrel protein [Lacticaseibacillus sp. NCIMB 15471]WLV76960.1 TIM barrel protein [Lacticaseibacillus sp. NCIMB 15471]
MLLGLKASTDERQIRDRLQYHPDVFEFHLTENDFTAEGWAHFLKMVTWVRSQVPTVVFHHPMRFRGQRNELAMNPTKYPTRYDFMMTSSIKLMNLAKKVNATALIHGGYRVDTPGDYAGWTDVAKAQDVALARMIAFAQEAPGHVVFENSMSPIFRYGDPDFEARILRWQLPLAYDTSHTFITLHGDNDRLMASLANLKPLVRHYHLVDSMGKTHDSLPLGQGRIDWARVLPLLNPKASRIYEIGLKDQFNCEEMIASHHYLEKVAEELAAAKHPA